MGTSLDPDVEESWSEPRPQTVSGSVDYTTEGLESRVGSTKGVV